MSCEGHRRQFFETLSGPNSPLAELFGSSTEAVAALEQIFNTARAQAPRSDKVQLRQAEAGTRALFAQMQALGIKPPTHSASGLPKRDAQYGYAAVYQTLDAIRKRAALPGLARAILARRSRTRQISALGEDERGYYRCATCGRFASRVNEHLCPATTDAAALNRALVRRLGAPASAYGGGQALAELIAAARAGGVTLRHGLTGETVQASLDGLPLALATGFLPDAWQGQTTLAELPDGRIVGVLDATGLTPVQPAATATGQAAAAYGVSLPPAAPVASAATLPPVAYHAVQAAATTGVSGGQAYDWGHFVGTEYRKGGSQGTAVAVYGRAYTVGDHSLDTADWSSARVGGLEAAPPNGVVVGRTLVAAMGLLAQGDVVETGDGKIELYEAGRSNLLAVYDPQTGIAGDTAGSPNASAAQLAAVVAQRALHPQTAFDTALALDLSRMHEGIGTPLAAADSAYLTLKHSVFAGGGTLTLGGSAATGRCATCGRFMGDDHVCPGKIVDSEQLSVGSEQWMAIGEQPAIPDRQPPTVAPPPTVNDQPPTLFDAPTFAAAIREGLQGLFPTAAPQAIATQVMGELRAVMTQMAQAVEALAKAQGKAKAAPAAADARLVEAVARLEGAIATGERTVAGEQIIAPTPAGRCPKCGQFMDTDHQCPERQPRQGKPRPDGLPLTAQEHIVSPVTLPAPDPYLANIPRHVGGDLYRPLEEHIPDLDPNFEINAQTERILRSMSAMIQSGAGKPRSCWTRAFGVYGPAGTGKNTLARQLAAALRTVDEAGRLTQGMNFVEADITPESSMQDLIGATVLTTDPQTGSTVSKAQLGKIGLAAAQGSVICINEIVRSPKLATALQSMIEDGEIRIDSPEGGQIKIPVHPSTVFVATWNPGFEGDAERPAQAPLSRLMTWRLDDASPEEKERRVMSFFAQLRGATQAVDENEARRQELLAKAYATPADLTPTPDETRAAIRLFNEIAAMSGGGATIGRQLGLNSATPTAPGMRELNRFLALGRAVGWEEALELLKVVCDQDDKFPEQWRMIQERFQAHFGADGGAVVRRQSGQSPGRA